MLQYLYSILSNSFLVLPISLLLSSALSRLLQEPAGLNTFHCHVALVIVVQNTDLLRMSDAWCCAVRDKTGWPGVSILWLYVCTTDRKMVTGTKQRMSAPLTEKWSQPPNRGCLHHWPKNKRSWVPKGRWACLNVYHKDHHWWKNKSRLR